MCLHYDSCLRYDIGYNNELLAILCHFFYATLGYTIPQNFVTTTVQSYAEERMQQINQRIMSFSRLAEIIDQFGLYPAPQLAAI